MFGLDVLVIPINLKNKVSSFDAQSFRADFQCVFNTMFLAYILVLSQHWILALLDMQAKKIQMYDSFHVRYRTYPQAVLKYVEAEWEAKKGGEEFPNGWKVHEKTPRGTYRQDNGNVL